MDFRTYFLLFIIINFSSGCTAGLLTDSDIIYESRWKVEGVITPDSVMHDYPDEFCAVMDFKYKGKNRYVIEEVKVKYQMEYGKGKYYHVFYGNFFIKEDTISLGNLCNFNMRDCDLWLELADPDFYNIFYRTISGWGVYEMKGDSLTIKINQEEGDYTMLLTKYYDVKLK